MAHVKQGSVSGLASLRLESLQVESGKLHSDHTKFCIPTNQRRQKLDPNQSDPRYSKGPLELGTLRHTTVSLPPPLLLGGL